MSEEDYDEDLLEEIFGEEQMQKNHKQEEKLKIRGKRIYIFGISKENPENYKTCIKNEVVCWGRGEKYPKDIRKLKPMKNLKSVKNGDLLLVILNEKIIALLEIRSLNSYSPYFRSYERIFLDALYPHRVKINPEPIMVFDNLTWHELNEQNFITCDGISTKSQLMRFLEHNCVYFREYQTDKILKFLEKFKR